MYYTLEKFENQLNLLMSLYLTLSIICIVVYYFIFRYHEWMKSAELRYLTGSEILTLEEEFQMQQRWHQDEDSEYINHLFNTRLYRNGTFIFLLECTFIILEKSIFSETEDEIGTDDNTILPIISLLLSLSIGY